MDLDAIVAQYGAKLLRYAAAILGNHADAEDAVQDAFIAAYKNQSRFDGENTGAWLYKITHNICLNKKRRRAFFFLADVREEPAAKAPEMPEVFAALVPLKPRERAILYMRIVEGYSYGELAEIMNARAATLRKLFERAKKKAAVLLDDFKEEQHE